MRNIPIDVKTGLDETEEKEIVDIIDRIFDRVNDAQVAEAEAEEEKPLEVIGLMVSRDQVELLLSVLGSIKRNSDESVKSLVEPIIGPLVAAGFSMENYNIVEAVPSFFNPERLSVRVVQRVNEPVTETSGNENVEP